MMPGSKLRHLLNLLKLRVRLLQGLPSSFRYTRLAAKEAVSLERTSCCFVLSRNGTRGAALLRLQLPADQLSARPRAQSAWSSWTGECVLVLP